MTIGTDEEGVGGALADEIIVISLMILSILISCLPTASFVLNTTGRLSPGSREMDWLACTWEFTHKEIVFTDLFGRKLFTWA